MKIPEEIIEAAKGAMFRFSAHPPTVFVHGTRQKAWFTLTMPDTYLERLAKMKRAGMAVAQWGKTGELTQVFYVCEGWASPPRASFVRPAEDPDRTEVLLINALDVAANTQTLAMYTCERDATNEVVALKPLLGGNPAEAASDLLPSFVAGFRALKR